MTNEELLDDYAANRMTEAERAAFEERLAADPALRDQARFQQTVADGIRQARALELKARLQRVPVSAPAVTWSGHVWRAAAAVAGTGLLVAASLYYVRSGRHIPTDTLAAEVGRKLPFIQPAQPQPAEEPKQETQQPAATPKTTDGAADNKARPAQRAIAPALAITDPTADLAEQPLPKNPATENTTGTPIAVADVSVAVHHNTQHDFHYQFDEAGLRLYGPFDKDLFEVLEIKGASRTCFLFYQNTFYTLADNQKTIARLEPVTNPRLLQLLQAYRQP